MRQVLFHIPLVGIPVYGYGMMLFFAFIGCTWLATRLARRQGIPNPGRMQDMAIWLFIGGILGARLVYIYEEWPTFSQGLSFWRVIALWDGGLTFYGGMFGGAAAYFLFWYRHLRPDGVSNWKMADVIAPCLALGAGLGRIGCLLTGCCFGNVAGPGCPTIHFPIPSGPNLKLISEGYETPLGFLLGPGGQVEVVEAHSNAARAGVKPGDLIVSINGQPLLEVDGQPATVSEGLRQALTTRWPRGEQMVHLTVRHADGTTEELPPFIAWGLGVHPTQLYETISMALLLFFLLSYFPYRRHEGELLAYLMLGYAAHRYVNEMLRTDNAIEAFGLTLSQLISIGIFAGGLILTVVVWLRAPRTPAYAARSAPPIPAPA